MCCGTWVDQAIDDRAGCQPVVYALTQYDIVQQWGARLPGDYATMLSIEQIVCSDGITTRRCITVSDDDEAGLLSFQASGRDQLGLVLALCSVRPCR